MPSSRLPALLCASMLLTVACRSGGSPEARSEAALAREASAPLAAQRAEALAASSASPSAELGHPAPDFELADQDGQLRRLSDFAGKPVVLEWFNPACPYVVSAHRDGALADCARELAQQGVAWLAINSGASDEAGNSLEQNRAAREEFGMQHPLLFDPSGRVGRMYQARCTPHLFVIDAQGLLVYSGALDNAQEESREEPLHYVRRALEEMKSGQVAIPRTRPYGSFVNYVD